MSHSCRALVFHCIDFRFGPALKNWMEEQSLLGDADIIALAGASKNIVDPSAQTFALHQIELSKKLHGIREAHLVNHTDCGAYGGRDAFANEAAERETHLKDLEEAARAITQAHPDVTVVRWLAHIEQPEHGKAKIWLEKLT